jgi:beta-xylosidase
MGVTDHSSQQDDGSYMMYYSATTTQDTSKHCVGAAKASSVTGPYTPVSDQPLICPLDQGGAIDSSVYNNNGERYITWKVDGNAIGHGGACGNTGKLPEVESDIASKANLFN